MAKQKAVRRSKSSPEDFVVPGFQFGAATAGLKDSGRPDVGLIVADTAAVAAGVFTTNRFRAAPVALAEDREQRSLPLANEDGGDLHLG